MFRTSCHARFVIAAFSICCTMTAQADPGLVYQFDSEVKVHEVNGLVGIEAPMVAPGDNCEQRIAEVVVDEVVYDGASDMVAGFRANKPAPKEWYGIFRIDTNAVYGAMPNAAHGDILKLIKKGAPLIVTYQVCGSGGFVSVRDIFKKSALNNP